MDLRPTPEQRDLRAATRAVCQDIRRGIASDARLEVKGVWRALTELGVFALQLPTADGGMGLGVADTAIVFEEFGHKLIPGPLVATQLAARHLPAAADGSAIVSEIYPDRGPWIVEHPDSFDHLAVIGEDSIRLVCRDTVGLLRAMVPMDPLTPVGCLDSLGDLIPVVALGPEDRRRWYLESAILAASMQVGIAQAALEMSVAYATGREQFGRAIGSFQAVKHMAADMLVRTEVARSAVFAASTSVDENSFDKVRSVAGAKMLADRAAQENSRTAVQIHGGMGFAWEVDVHLYLKRSWLLATTPMSTDSYADVVADAL